MRPVCGLVLAALLFGCDEDDGHRANDAREAGAVDARNDASTKPARPRDGGSRFPPEPDAPVRPRPTSERDDPPPDSGSTPTQTGEGGASPVAPLRPTDAGLPSVETPPDGGDIDASAPLSPLDCGASAPSLAFDRVALVEGNRLVLRTFDTGEAVVASTWSDAFVPSPPVAFTVESGEPGFALALSNGTWCRVEAINRSGELLWVTEVPARACVAPTPYARDLWLPLQSTDGTGSLELLRASDGARLATTGLPSRPTTSLAELGGGGSHWIGGSEDGLYVIESDGAATSVWAHDTPELGGVSRLAVYAEDRVGAASESALGRYRIDVASQTVEVVGEPIVTLGPVTSNLVASVDCGDRAGGATHFFCDTGIFAAGGEGWLSAWRLDDGELWFDVSVDETLQGLALLGDGRLLGGGGSHWLDRDGRVRLYSMSGPDAPIEVLHSAPASEPSCVGSPVVDTDGKLGLAFSSRSAGEFVTLETGAPGLASGWSRDGGDNPTRSSGANADSSCEQGSERLFERFVGPELVRSSAVLVLPDGGFVITGLGTSGILAGFSAGGTQVWSHALTPPAPAIVALTSSGERLFGFAMDAGTVRVAVLALDGSLVDERTESVPGLISLVGAHALPDGNVVLVGTRTGSDAFPEPANSDATLLVFDTTGTLVGTNEMVDATALLPVASALVPGTSDLVLTGAQSNAGGFVTRVALDGSVTWFDQVLGARAELRGVSVAVSADGRSTVAFSNGPHALLHRYDALGARALTAPTSFVVPAELGENTSGTWLLDQGGGVHRVLDQLTLVPLRPAPTTEPLTAVDLAPLGTGAVVVADVSRVDGSTGVFVAHLDGEARSGCASAGLCVTSAECPSEGPCGAGHCEPSSGECSVQPAPDLESCGSSDVCYAGSCGPVPPEVDAPRTLEASSCFDVQSYAECVPYALSYATLVLHEDGTIESSDPGATGTWREPAGPGSIEFVFRDLRTGEVLSTFTGQLAFDRCWEGTVEAAAVAPGAFRACQT